MPNWIDVTEDFFRTAQEAVEPDELIMEDDFQLEDAMMAIDVMDPKMDRGLIREGGKRLEAFRQDFLLGLPFSPLGSFEEDPSLTAAAMDSLFRLEATFFGIPGKSFSETLGISLLTHRPEYMERGNPTLTAFTRGVVRGVELIAGVVRTANVTGSEDFNQRGLGQQIDLTRAGLDPSIDQLIASLERDVDAADGIGWHCKRLSLWLQIANLASQATEVDDDGWMKFDSLLDSLLDHLHDSPSLLPEMTFDLADVGTFPSMANLSPMGIPKANVSIYPISVAIDSFATLLRTLKMVPRLLLAGHDQLDLRRLCFQEIKSETWNPITYSLLFVALHGTFSFDPAMENHLLDILQVQCHSPARKRRLWPKVLLSLDQSLSGYFADSALWLHDELRWWRWRGSAEIVLLGFPLELYVPREYSQVLWVLSKLYGCPSLLACAKMQRHANPPPLDASQIFLEAAFTKRWARILAPMDLHYTDYLEDMSGESDDVIVDPEVLRLLSLGEPTLSDLYQIMHLLSPPPS